MEPKDAVTAVFGAAVGLAGVLLVFVGFVYSHAESQPLADDRVKFKRVAKVGLIPFLVCFVCAFLCMNWMSSQSPQVFHWLFNALYAGLGLTALYGIVAFLFYL